MQSPAPPHPRIPAFAQPPETSKIIPSAPPSFRYPVPHSPPPAALTVSSPQSIDAAPAIDSWAPPSSADSASTAFWDYQMLFLSQRAETSDPVLLRVVDGTVPTDLPRGTYYLTGPGIFVDDYGSAVHPLDGHGYLRSFSFSGAGGGVRYAARYVETEAVKEEREVGTGRWRFTHRGPFSVLKGGRRVGNMKVMKNVANTAVLRWGGRLFCLWEGGNPYEIDPNSMETMGAVDLVGEAKDNMTRREALPRDVALDVAAAVIRPVLYGIFKMHPKRMISHYKIDGERNRLLLLTCSAEDLLLPRANFTFYEFDDNFELKQKKEFIIPDHLFIHDWAFTENHYILFGNRIKLDIPGALLAVSGLSSMISALSLNPNQSKTPIYLLPRSTASEGKPRDWEVPIEAPSQLWISHVENAFEEDEGGGRLHLQIQASACSYQWFNMQKMFGYNWQNRRLDPAFMNAAEGNEEQLPHLVKVSIELDEMGECRSCTVANSSRWWPWPADFPTINQTQAGRKNRFTYAGTASGSRRHLPHFPFDSVLKLDGDDGKVRTWWAGDRKFVGEPTFVAKGTGDEDDGYVLVVEVREEQISIGV
ncbi:hypothetical protein HPP92_022076 [Vanilla planifolia]|uniref:Carotenoid cleavage dioxygenase 7 n=1 Tax=Vanilla planifolia TaxID=51239 RepID=A0A835UF34_VANPL|nr:hypothetical protein HPP92_022076 [Vanilla planifolia]